MSRRSRELATTRCVDGRLMRHDPMPDDPYLETDIGKCPECEGDGCRECDCCGKERPLSRCWAAGMTETWACDECRGEENEGD